MVPMALSFGQLCMRCRSLFCTKTLAVTWQHSNQVQYCSTVIGEPAKTLNGSSFISKNHTSQSRQRWQHKIFFQSDLTVKHLATEATEEKGPKTDVVAYKSPLLPIKDTLPATESQASVASISLGDYVDKSETLSKLVQLGVNLWKLEQKPNVGSMLLRLDFNRDVAPRLLFLKEIGVEDSRLGYIVTHNPYVFTENTENLQIRVNYLKSKKFSPETIASMVSRAPYLLNFSVKRLDNRLGFYQQQLNISASNTRNIVARLPKLLCGSLEPVKENLKVCEIELGFKENEIQHIVMAVPKVLIANKRKLTQIFDFLHNTMKVPHQLIAKFPQVLNTKYLRIRERHLFLKYLGKAQYDPALPNYISLDSLVTLPDETFCTNLASATLEDFYLFQKTL
ncbi:transcription termination factor 3, mitochondrial isoform X3 [Channa argus]|uniref:transcription termination factor 3, mitochondrial isoform X3 n=1 Tax=Channa argus TaxID=215402 RepID=UPI00352273F3